MARSLVAMHHGLRRHPSLHRLSATLVNRFVGEKRVNAAILRLTRPGDCIWDVGANVGFYTRQLLNRVGAGGHVVAVEPVPTNAERLRGLAPATRLTVIEAALGASDGEVPLVVSGDSAETSHIRESSDARLVALFRADTLLAKGVRRPDVLKLDVEGSEGDVLDGAPGVLRGLRAVVVEVHFAALARQGRPREPIRIVKLLENQRFAVKWTDSSHLVATR